MKTAESRTASNTVMRKSNPFFSKESDGHFFGSQQRTSSSPALSSSVQAKLNVGSPNDPYEKEADSTADKVVQRLAEPAVQTKPLAPVPITPYVQKKTKNAEEDKKVKELVEEEDPSPDAKKLQRKPIFESNAEPPDDRKPVQRKCKECEKEEKLQKKFEGQPIQRKPIFESSKESSREDETVQRKCAACETEDKLQKKADDHHTGNVEPEIENSLNSSKGSGRPLPDNTRQQMESSIGADFSNVRIHDDSNAAQMSKDLNAQAFTHGDDIYFNSGKYDTASSGGQHLLAHELTHTVQQSGGNRNPIREKIQRTSGSPANPDFKKTSKKDLENAGDSKIGYVEKSSGGVFKFHIAKIKTGKYYLTDGDKKVLKGKLPCAMPKHKRETKQESLWNGDVRDKVRENLMDVAHLDPNKKLDTGKLYKMQLIHKKAGNKGIVGTFTQIANEVLVPMWDSKGAPKVYQVEHMVDWQILGDDADDISNLILLEADRNQKAGNDVKKVLGNSLKDLVDLYKKGFSNVPEVGEIRKNPDFLPYVDKFDGDGPDLNDSDYYYRREFNQKNNAKNPFKDEFVTIKEEKIPPNHFLLTSSDDRASYLIPKSNRRTKVGAFYISTTLAADGKTVKSITMETDLKQPIKIIKVNKDTQKSVVDVNMESVDKYVIKDKSINGVVAPMFKSMTLPKFSPIVINDDDIKIDGFNVSVTGKVKSTLSFLKDVDISFAYENGDFDIKAVIPLDQIGKNVPKPFKVDFCNIEIGGGSKTELYISGALGFSIEKLGNGEIYAKLDKSVTLEGKFNFDSKYFDPAEISVTYSDGKWSFTGSIGIKPGLVKGVKKASLTVGYAESVFTLDGDAELTVPGIDKIKLHADFAENGDFTFIASVDLKKMTGIKSGSATITITSKGEEGLKLGLKGEAEPDLPNVPSLNGIKLAISYQDGIFELKAHVPFKKGKFDGAIDVGVTNRTVDETGKPQGEAPEKGDVVVFGYGQLGVDIYKGIHGSVSIRLTPDKEVLIGGKIEAKELKPFGDGYNYDKEIISFPTIEFPLVGIPGLSVSAFIGGGVHFKFNWQPLILKDLSLDFKETNIKDLASVSLEIMGSVGSSAHAEVYLKIEAGLKARAAIAVLTGSLAGEAGLGLDAEAGGKVDATWDMEKGLKFKEIRAFLNVEPKAIFRLTGNVKVDLDLWIAKVNIYEHEWVLAEKQLDLSGITLKLDFPIQFQETGEVKLPEYEAMNVQKPDFTGDAGNKILDDAINGDAKKEEAAKKEKLKAQIHNDMRSADNKDVSPSDYEKKMREKYEDTPELQTFVSTTIHDEAKKIEYEDFEQLKDKLRKDPAPAEAKYVQVNVFQMFHGYVEENDYEALKSELKKIDEDKKLAAANAANNTTPPDPNKPAGDTPSPPAPPPPPPVSSAGNNSTPVQTKPEGRADTIQRKEDKHDLSSKELAGDPILEQCFDGPRAVVNPEVGLHVKRIQEGLIRLGIELPEFGVDGKYGKETENAVKEFQEKAGMSEPERDGKVGKKTIALLDMSLRNNSISSDPDKAADDLVLHNPKQIKDDEDCKGKPDDEPCPVPNKDVNEAADAAIALIDRVINEQLPPNKTSKADYTSLFEVLFRTNDTRDVKVTAEEVKKNYIEIKKFLELIKKDPTHVRCATACDGGCRSGSPAYHGKSGDLHILTFCPDFKSDPDRIFIVLHESHHAAIKGSRDIAYQHTRLIDKLDHQQALLNAASFHMYAKLVNDPSSDQIGPAVKDSDSIADPDKKKKAELALADIEQWMNLVTFDMSVVSADMDKAKNNGKYGEDANLKKINIYVNWLNITAPPAKPTESDIAQAKAMEERTRLMEDAFDQVFDISESADSSSWERGPGTDISLNQNLLALDIRHMVIALLQELVHATPDVSAEREPLYVGIINDLRNNRKLAP
jgi:peptidoglycan hydrolase-like protein with peptidoglycan-binding domain